MNRSARALTDRATVVMALATFAAATARLAAPLPLWLVATVTVALFAARRPWLFVGAVVLLAALICVQPVSEVIAVLSERGASRTWTSSAAQPVGRPGVRLAPLVAVNAAAPAAQKYGPSHWLNFSAAAMAPDGAEVVTQDGV